jgi:hypothetical protein
MSPETDLLDAPLSAREVAGKEIDATEGTLASWRSQGRGPVYYKSGRIVWYTRRDIQAWRREVQAHA